MSNEQNEQKPSYNSGKLEAFIFGSHQTYRYITHSPSNKKILQILFGPTGAGKTTLGCYKNNEKLQEMKQDNEIVVLPESYSSGRVSSSTKSVTRDLQVLGNSLEIPGTSTTLGDEHTVSTALYTYMFASELEQIDGICIVLEYNIITQKRGAGLTEFIEELGKIIEGDIDILKKSLYFVITKSDNKKKDVFIEKVKDIIRDLWLDLNEDKSVPQYIYTAIRKAVSFLAVKLSSKQEEKNSEKEDNNQKMPTEKHLEIKKKIELLSLLADSNRLCLVNPFNNESLNEIQVIVDKLTPIRKKDIASIFKLKVSGGWRNTIDQYLLSRISTFNQLYTDKMSKHNEIQDKSGMYGKYELFDESRKKLISKFENLNQSENNEGLYPELKLLLTDQKAYLEKKIKEKTLEENEKRQALIKLDNHQPCVAYDEHHHEQRPLGWHIENAWDWINTGQKSHFMYNSASCYSSHIFYYGKHGALKTSAFGEGCGIIALPHDLNQHRIGLVVQQRLPNNKDLLKQHLVQCESVYLIELTAPTQIEILEDQVIEKSTQTKPHYIPHGKVVIIKAHDGNSITAHWKHNGDYQEKTLKITDQTIPPYNELLSKLTISMTTIRLHYFNPLRENLLTFDISEEEYQALAKRLVDKANYNLTLKENENTLTVCTKLNRKAREALAEPTGYTCESVLYNSIPNNHAADYALIEDKLFFIDKHKHTCKPLKLEKKNLDAFKESFILRGEIKSELPCYQEVKYFDYRLHRKMPEHLTEGVVYLSMDEQLKQVIVKLRWDGVTDSIYLASDLAERIMTVLLQDKKALSKKDEQLLFSSVNEQGHLPARLLSKESLIVIKKLTQHNNEQWHEVNRSPRFGMLFSPEYFRYTISAGYQIIQPNVLVAKNRVAINQLKQELRDLKIAKEALENESILSEEEIQQHYEMVHTLVRKKYQLLPFKETPLFKDIQKNKILVYFDEDKFNAALIDTKDNVRTFDITTYFSDKMRSTLKATTEKSSSFSDEETYLLYKELFKIDVFISIALANLPVEEIKKILIENIKNKTEHNEQLNKDILILNDTLRNTKNPTFFKKYYRYDIANEIVKKINYDQKSMKFTHFFEKINHEINALFEAIQWDHVPTIKEILGKNIVHQYVTNQHYRSILHEAAKCGSQQLIEYFINELKFSITSNSAYYMPPILKNDLSVERGYALISLKELPENEEDYSVIDDQTFSSAFAFFKGELFYIDLVKKTWKFITNNSDHLKVINEKLLISHFVNQSKPMLRLKEHNLIYSDRNTIYSLVNQDFEKCYFPDPYVFALYYRQLHVLDMLLPERFPMQRINLNYIDRQQLQYLSVPEIIIAKGLISVLANQSFENKIDFYHYTRDPHPELGNLLHVAIWYDQLGMAVYLLDHHKQREHFKKLLKQRDSKGRTPLELAAFLGNIEFISLLVKKYECDVNGENLKYLPPLGQAILAKKPDVLTYLLYLGASVKQPYEFAYIHDDYHNKSMRNLIDTLCEKNDKNTELLDIKNMFTNFLENPKLVIKRRPIHNIQFKGGGMKGPAYIGLAQEIQPVIKGCKHFTGSSVGSLTAAIYAIVKEEDRDPLLHQSISELLDYFDDSIDINIYKNEMDNMWEHPFAKLFSLVTGREENNFSKWFSVILGSVGVITKELTQSNESLIKLCKIIDKYGAIFQGKKLRRWIDKAFEKQTGIKFLTFGELRRLINSNKENNTDYKDLSITITAIIPLEKGGYTLKTEKLSSVDALPGSSHENIIISYALQISCALPLIFANERLHEKKFKESAAKNKFYRVKQDEQVEKDNNLEKDEQVEETKEGTLLLSLFFKAEVCEQLRKGQKVDDVLFKEEGLNEKEANVVGCGIQ